MFTHWFSAEARTRYRASPYKTRIDQAGRSLVDQRYLAVVVRDRVHEWLRFTEYLADHALALPDDIRAPDVQRYIEARPSAVSASRVRVIRASVRIFLEIDQEGQFARRIAAVKPPVPSWCAEAVLGYLAGVRQHHGLSPKTVSKRRFQLVAFAESLTGAGVRALTELAVRHIQDFCRQLAGRAVLTRRSYVGTVRSFLRWAHDEGLVSRDLSGAAMAARLYRLRSVPDVLTVAEVDQILSAVDRSSPIGRRDYAVLVLAARYGLRPGDIRQLGLDHIDWRRGLIAIRQAKTGRPLVLPLLPDVAEAVSAYVRHGRPTTSRREVFVRHRAPFEPFVPANNLASIMRTALQRAGLATRPGRRGLYLFRHTLATRLLEAGHPLKTVSDLLGHVCLDSTFGYTKVDLTHLRAAALSEAEVA